MIMNLLKREKERGKKCVDRSHLHHFRPDLSKKIEIGGPSPGGQLTFTAPEAGEKEKGKILTGTRRNREGRGVKKGLSRPAKKDE